MDNEKHPEKSTAKHFYMMRKNLQAPVTPASKNIERQFSLSAYLVQEKYQQVTPRVFVKDDSPEIIRLSRRSGKTYFRNFLIPADRGTALDFLCHRSHTEGAIIPNQEVSCIQRALTKALCFIGGQGVTAEKGLAKGTWTVRPSGARRFSPRPYPYDNTINIQTWPYSKKT